MDTTTLDKISRAIDAVADYTADYPNTTLVVRGNTIAVCMPDNEPLVEQLRNWLTDFNDHGYGVNVEIFVEVKPTNPIG